MARSREVGTARSRPQTKGRVPQNIGTRVGQSLSRPIAAPPLLKRTYTHCESLNKKGLPCKAPNVTGQPYCQGHLNAQAAKVRSESARAS